MTQMHSPCIESKIFPSGHRSTKGSPRAHPTNNSSLSGCGNALKKYPSHMSSIAVNSHDSESPTKHLNWGSLKIIPSGHEK